MLSVLIYLDRSKISIAALSNAGVQRIFKAAAVTYRRCGIVSFDLVSIIALDTLLFQLGVRRPSNPTISGR